MKKPEKESASRSKVGIPTPAVHVAVMRQSASELQTLLAQGHDVNAVDRMGRSPLFYAVVDKLNDVFDVLIANRADVNHADNDGRTALHAAAIHCKASLAKRLIELGAAIDPQDTNGNTPLMDAVFYSQGKGDVIELLLEAGADRDCENHHGVSPIELANTITDFDVARFFK
jgi:ankyrin repeat protein